MCIICLEFNKYKDIQDAERMLEAARREANAISPEHLALVEAELRRRRSLKAPQEQPLELDE